VRRRECRVCDGRHDAALHAAKLSVRRWLRDHSWHRLGGCSCGGGRSHGAGEAYAFRGVTADPAGRA
jgi:hypothetical protein